MPSTKRAASGRAKLDPPVVPNFPNDYCGWHPDDGDTGVEVISADIDPREFFDRFVATRRPCIIDGVLQDETFRVSAQRALTTRSTVAAIICATGCTVVELNGVSRSHASDFLPPPLTTAASPTNSTALSIREGISLDR